MNQNAGINIIHYVKHDLLDHFVGIWINPFVLVNRSYFSKIGHNSLRIYKPGCTITVVTIIICIKRLVLSAIPVANDVNISR